MARRSARIPILIAALLGLAIAAPATASGSLLAPAATARSFCGVERWDVKTLSDPARKQVNFHPLDTTVQHLRHLARPASVGIYDPRKHPVEFRTYKIRAQVIAATVEADHDIHLIVSVPGQRHATMITEFPNPRCIASAFKRPAMSQARRAMLSNCGSIPTGSFVNLKGVVTMTGVGFWDIKHGQTGVAPNAIELHPVLSIKGTCS